MSKLPCHAQRQWGEGEPVDDDDNNDDDNGDVRVAFLGTALLSAARTKIIATKLSSRCAPCGSWLHLFQYFRADLQVLHRRLGRKRSQLLPLLLQEILGGIQRVSFSRFAKKKVSFFQSLFGVWASLTGLLFLQQSHSILFRRPRRQNLNRPKRNSLSPSKPSTHFSLEWVTVVPD